MALAVAPLPWMLRTEANTSTFNYEVQFSSLSADGLDGAPGIKMLFVWKRHGKLSMTESAEIGDGGGVAWDSACTQVCTLLREGGSGWRPKPCELQVQAVQVDADGNPAGTGAVVAAATLDLSHYCAAEAVRPQSLTIQLSPTGTLRLRIASRWLPTAAFHPATASESSSVLSLSPVTSSASLATDSEADPSALSLAALGYASSSCSPLPRPGSPHGARLGQPWPVDADTTGRQPHYEEDATAEERLKRDEGCGALKVGPGGGAGQHEVHARCSGDFGVDGRWGVGGWGAEEGGSPGGAGHGQPEQQQEGPSFHTPLSASNSSGLARESSAGEGTVAALQRRCKRLARERDEARAEAFAEASVAVQRGIEIENLKRAKDMLLARMEASESQLMMMMRSDMMMMETPQQQQRSAAPAHHPAGPAPADRDGSGGAEAGSSLLSSLCGDDSPRASGDGDASFVRQLVESKVALAEKELEVMELQGRVRAREAALEAMALHLAAVRAEAAARLYGTPVAAMPRCGSFASLIPPSPAAASQGGGSVAETPRSLAAAVRAAAASFFGGGPAVEASSAERSAGSGLPGAAAGSPKVPLQAFEITAHAGAGGNE